MRNIGMGVVLGLCVFVSSALAQRVFIDERQAVGIYAQPNTEGTVLSTLSSGAEVEVLETLGLFVKIRSGHVEGWTRARYVTSDQPLSMQLKAAQDENAWLRGQLNGLKVERVDAAGLSLATQLSQAEVTIRSLRAELSKQRSLPDVVGAASADEVVRLKQQLDEANGKVLSLQQQLAEPVSRLAPESVLIRDSEPEESGMEVKEDGWRASVGLGLWVVSALVLGFVSGWVVVSRKVRRSFHGLKVW